MKKDRPDDWPNPYNWWAIIGHCGPTEADVSTMWGGALIGSFFAMEGRSEGFSIGPSNANALIVPF